MDTHLSLLAKQSCSALWLQWQGWGWLHGEQLGSIWGKDTVRNKTPPLDLCFVCPCSFSLGRWLHRACCPAEYHGPRRLQRQRTISASQARPKALAYYASKQPPLKEVVLLPFPVLKTLGPAQVTWANEAVGLPCSTQAPRNKAWGE